MINYHRKSIEIEKKKEQELLLLLTILLVELNTTKQLTKATINEIVTRWTLENWSLVNEINRDSVEATYRYVNSIMPEHAPTDDIPGFTKANNDMFFITVDYIKQKYIELGIQEGYYNLNDEASTEFINDIADAVANKIELFSTMSVVQTMQAFIIANAEYAGYIEYRWHSQRDNKVRPSHAWADGKWFGLDNPPKETGYCHPGQDYNCRCYMSDFR